MNPLSKTLALAALAYCAVLQGAISGAPLFGQNVAEVRIGTTPGKNISPTFMGYSIEWNQNFIGDSATGTNAIFRQLSSNLTAYGSGPLVIRMGGNTSDQRQEPTPNMDQPLADLGKDLGARFILGVNLASGNPNMAADEARADVSQMPPGSILGFEVGNEPDHYHTNGVRQSSYTIPDYFAQFDRWKQTILPVLPNGIKLVGPAWGSYMQRYNRQFLADNHDALSLMSQHYYVTEPRLHPPDDLLLMPKSATTEPMAVASTVAMAHFYGLPFRVDEYNTADDSGIEGISNVFSAALWAVDNMFEFANVGVDGVNWETSNWSADRVQLFAFTIGKSGRMKTYALRYVNPLYYGLVFFQAATGNRARLLPVTLNTQANLKAWATIDIAGKARLTLINKEESSSANVAVTMPGYSHAAVLRLTAPSYSSTTGAAFAGQTIGVDGALAGPRNVETVSGANGAFEIPMPAASAALVAFIK